MKKLVSILMAVLMMAVLLQVTVLTASLLWLSIPALLAAMLLSQVLHIPRAPTTTCAFIQVWALQVKCCLTTTVSPALSPLVLSVLMPSQWYSILTVPYSTMAS